VGTDRWSVRLTPRRGGYLDAKGSWVGTDRWSVRAGPTGAATQGVALRC